MKITKIINLFAFSAITAAALLACGGGGSGGHTVFDVWNGSTEEILPNGLEYKVNSAAQLAWLAEKISYSTDENYKLASNIDLDGRPWKPIGDQTSPFKGTFDGNGFTIKGLEVPNNEKFAGLFGYIGGGAEETEIAEKQAVIENLKIELVNNSHNSAIAEAWGSGTLAGGVENAILKNIFVSGDDLNVTSGSGEKLSAGGIAGALLSTEIINSASIINVTAISASETAYAGGITGLNNGKITSCYATGNITAISTLEEKLALAGGLVGNNNGTITSSYASGNVIAESALFYAYAGGIAGHVGSYSSIERNAALNKTVEASLGITKYAGGITSNNDGVFDNNIVVSDMQITPMPDFDKPNNGTLVNFNDLTETEYTGSGHIVVKNGEITGGLNWNPNEWDFSGQYPILSIHLQ